MAIGGCKYVSKITYEYIKWTAVYLMINKNQPLQSLQLFVGLTVIPFGSRIVRWRADKGGVYTGDEFRQYCLKIGIIQEFAATNTPQQIGMSERVGRTLCTIVECMLANSGFPTSIWGELFMAAAYLKNSILHKALKMKTPFKMFHKEEADLSHLCVIGVRTFVHTKDSRKLDAAAWKGEVCSYSEEMKLKDTSCRGERKRHLHRDTPAPTSSTFKVLSVARSVPPSWDIDDDTLDNDHISYGELLRDVRDYIGVLSFIANAPANHENAIGVSVDRQVQELVD